MKMNVRVDGHEFDVVIEDVSTNPVVAIVDGQRIEVWPEAAHPAVLSGPELRPAPASAPAAKAVLSPIPGVIVSVAVNPGDVVSYGQELCVLEAMKMKQAIRSGRDGTIEQVAIEAGQAVGHRALLVSYAD